jgi:Domain of unknown function (DUF4157)
MFAPKVIEAQTKACANPTSNLAQQRTTPAAYGFYRPVKQPRSSQSGARSKATLRPPSERGSSDWEKEAVPEMPRRASWDFSKIPTFPAIQGNLPEIRFPDQEPKADLTGPATQPRRVESGDRGQIAAPPIVHEVLRSRGQPLDSGTRAIMEARFGYDFSGVRAHSGTAAEQSARDMNANAYTVGQNIVFGAGQFAPHQSFGRTLIAHELAHVVQQGSTKYPAASQGNCERDAEDAAVSVDSGNAPVVRTSAVSGTVQRQASTGPIAQASQKKSRLVRIERYWHSPSARAFFEDGSNEEVTFVEGGSLDPATQPGGGI